jgi:hypothetical protein
VEPAPAVTGFAGGKAARPRHLIRIGVDLCRYQWKLDGRRRSTGEEGPPADRQMRAPGNAASRDISHNTRSAKIEADSGTTDQDGWRFTMLGGVCLAALALGRASVIRGPPRDDRPITWSTAF